jgi:chorismate mutase
MRWKILPLLLALSAVPACGPAAVTPAVRRARLDAAFDELLGLMRARLALMHDVARWKWSAKSPIEDPTREATLLGEVADRGATLDLDPVMTRAFFAAQIEAAKLVQRADFRRWEADPPPSDAPALDLATVLRPRIDALNRDLLAALARAEPRLHSDDGAGARILIRADALLSGDGIDAEVRAAAIRPLILAAAE